MGAHIKFSMEHRYFRDWLEVDVDWNYPFLPRVGEFVNAWIWIEAGTFSSADIEKILNPDGQENLNSEFYRDYTLDDWLYEIGMECNKVYGVSYYREKNDPANIYARVRVSEPGTAL